MASILPREDRDGNLIGWQARVRKKSYSLQVKTFDRKVQAQAWTKQLEVEIGARRLAGPKRIGANAPYRSSGSVWSRGLQPEKSGQVELYRIRTVKADPIGKLTLAKIRGADVAAYRDRRLFEKGLNPMQVAAITGHKTLQMLKRYTHLRAEDLAKLLG